LLEFRPLGFWGFCGHVQVTAAASRSERNASANDYGAPRISPSTIPGTSASTRLYARIRSWRVAGFTHEGESTGLQAARVPDTLSSHIGADTGTQAALLSILT
jgi:hypothetical protein